jgi:hypothetical protein
MTYLPINKHHNDLLIYNGMLYPEWINVTGIKKKKKKKENNVNVGRVR